MKKESSNKYTPIHKFGTVDINISRLRLTLYILSCHSNEGSKGKLRHTQTKVSGNLKGGDHPEDVGVNI